MRHVAIRSVLWTGTVLLAVGGCAGRPGPACQPRPCWPPPCQPRACQPRACQPLCAPVCAPAPGGVAVPSPAAVQPLPGPGLAVTPSGFLSDYGRLRPNPRHEGAVGWMKEGLDLREYDHLVIEPIQVLLGPGSPTVELTAEQEKEVADAFRKVLCDCLDPYYSVVDEPGPTTLRLKLAITDLEPAKPGTAGGPPVSVGGADLEGQILDSVSGEVLVEAASRIQGSAQGTSAKPEWQPVEGAFREWSQRILDFLDSFKE